MRRTKSRTLRTSATAERRRRLVEDDQVGVVVHGPADRDALALAAGELRDGRIDGDADAAEADRLRAGCPAAIAFSFLMSMKPKRLVIWRPTKKLRQSGCFSASELVLVDRLDREVVRHPDRIVGEVDLLVADEDAGPRSARSTPVITLISVDLPAPLSPIRPTISLRPMAR